MDASRSTDRIWFYTCILCILTIRMITCLHDVALHKPADMSSVWTGTPTRHAGKVVDGVPSQHGQNHEECSTDNREQNGQPWWKVDFQSIYIVKHIVVTNAGMCYIVFRPVAF